MSFSCIRLSKICFVLSIITCTVLLLLIPKFQSSWRFKIYPQPRPSLVFNTFNKKDTPLQQVEFNSSNPLDAEINNIVSVIKENLLEKWNHHVTDTGGFHLKDNGKINERPHNVIRMESVEVSAKEKLELKDIFIAVKTTRKYHKTRLNLLFQTWISQAKGQVRTLFFNSYVILLVIFIINNYVQRCILKHFSKVEHNVLLPSQCWKQMICFFSYDSTIVQAKSLIQLKLKLKLK